MGQKDVFTGTFSECLNADPEIFLESTVISFRPEVVAFNPRLDNAYTPKNQCWASTSPSTITIPTLKRIVLFRGMEKSPCGPKNVKMELPRSWYTAPPPLWRRTKFTCSQKGRYTGASRQESEIYLFFLKLLNMAFFPRILKPTNNDRRLVSPPEKRMRIWLLVAREEPVLGSKVHERIMRSALINHQFPSCLRSITRDSR